MFEKLYDENFIPTETGNQVADDISSFLAPLYQRWIGKGLSPREMSYIVNDINKVMESQFLLTFIDPTRIEKMKII